MGEPCQSSAWTSPNQMFPLAWEDLGQSAQNCLFLWNVTPLASLGVLGKPFLFLCLADCSAGMEEEGQIIDFFSFCGSIMIWRLLES